MFGEKFVKCKAEVTSDHQTSTYIGMASNTFKERFTNHLASFRNSKYKESTILSQHILELKSNYKILILNGLNGASSYNPCSKKCNLCVMEKTLILTSEDLQSTPAE